MSKLTSFILFCGFKWVVVIFFIMFFHEHTWFRYEYGVILSFSIFTIFIIINQKHINAFYRLYAIRNTSLKNEETSAFKTREF
ncbi:MAG: hypothetical protein MJK11_11020 [Pseudomonadales bacterium]|nr:hypothetical protein [Pseudomonadales bacterium]